MGIDRESDISANLQIGPTSLGMVRIYVASETVELPLDFEPDEAEEIAAEIVAAAARAREIGGGGARDASSSGQPQRSGKRSRRRRMSGSST